MKLLLILLVYDKLFVVLKNIVEFLSLKVFWREDLGRVLSYEMGL